MVPCLSLSSTRSSLISSMSLGGRRFASKQVHIYDISRSCYLGPEIRQQTSDKHRYSFSHHNNHDNNHKWMEIRGAHHVLPIPYISHTYGDLIKHERKIDQRHNNIAKGNHLSFTIVSH